MPRRATKPEAKLQPIAYGSYYRVVRQFQIRPVDTDRYRRVADVYVAGQSINLQLVQEGMAVVYTEYLDGCPDSRR